mmetsp:Transcript_26457/g.54586  ORF Transcript_26457/g.54586 Transcript_26457/m.54586 type:complete len:326 (+) Transcript_26457:1032-2009(+)
MMLLLMLLDRPGHPVFYQGLEFVRNDGYRFCCCCFVVFVFFCRWCLVWQQQSGERNLLLLCRRCPSLEGFPSHRACFPWCYRSGNVHHEALLLLLLLLRLFGHGIGNVVVDAVLSGVIQVVGPDSVRVVRKRNRRDFQAHLVPRQEFRKDRGFGETAVAVDATVHLFFRQQLLRQETDPVSQLGRVFDREGHFPRQGKRVAFLVVRVRASTVSVAIGVRIVAATVHRHRSQQCPRDRFDRVAEGFFPPLGFHPGRKNATTINTNSRTGNPRKILRQVPALVVIVVATAETVVDRKPRQEKHFHQNDALDEQSGSGHWDFVSLCKL